MLPTKLYCAIVHVIINIQFQWKNSRAPPGCQRYMMETSGKIISMNFYKVTGSTYAAGAQNTGIDLGVSEYVNITILKCK